jgi:hypothetical protein
MCLWSSDGHWKNVCPQQARGSQKVPQIRGRGQAFEGKYQPISRRASPWEENIVALAGLEGYEEE